MSDWCRRQIRKRALAIVAGILVARQLKTTDDFSIPIRAGRREGQQEETGEVNPAAVVLINPFRGAF